MSTETPPSAKVTQQIPTIMGIGTAGGPDSREEMAKAVHVALKHVPVAGLDRIMIDTGQNYGSEPSIGDGLRLASNDGSLKHAYMLCKVDLCSESREEPSKRMRRQVQSTRSNVGMDVLDCVAFHWPLCLDRPVDKEEAKRIRKESWQELERMVLEEGWIRSLGVSNFTPELLDELLSFAKVKPCLNEVEFSPICYQKELVEQCRARNVAVVGYSPFGICWMSIYYPKFVPWGPTNLIENETVIVVAKEAKCTPAQALVQWSIRRGVSPIPKSLKPRRVEENLTAANSVTLTEDQLSRLDGLCDENRSTQASVDAHARIISSGIYDWTPT